MAVSNELTFRSTTHLWQRAQQKLNLSFSMIQKAMKYLDSAQQGNKNLKLFMSIKKIVFCIIDNGQPPVAKPR